MRRAVSGFADGTVSKGAVDDLRQQAFLGRKSTLAKLSDGFDFFFSSLDSLASAPVPHTR
jgi:hypothetical protein